MVDMDNPETQIRRRNLESTKKVGFLGSQMPSSPMISSYWSPNTSSSCCDGSSSSISSRNSSDSNSNGRRGPLSTSPNNIRISSRPLRGAVLDGSYLSDSDVWECMVSPPTGRCSPKEFVSRMNSSMNISPTDPMKNLLVEEHFSEDVLLKEPAVCSPKQDPAKCLWLNRIMPSSLAKEERHYQKKFTRPLTPYPRVKLWKKLKEEQESASKVSLEALPDKNSASETLAHLMPPVDVLQKSLDILEELKSDFEASKNKRVLVDKNFHETPGRSKKDEKPLNEVGNPDVVKVTKVAQELFTVDSPGISDFGAAEDDGGGVNCVRVGVGSNTDFGATGEKDEGYGELLQMRLHPSAILMLMVLVLAPLTVGVLKLLLVASIGFCGRPEDPIPAVYGRRQVGEVEATSTSYPWNIQGYSFGVVGETDIIGVKLVGEEGKGRGEERNEEEEEEKDEEKEEEEEEEKEQDDEAKEEEEGEGERKRPRNTRKKRKKRNKVDRAWNPLDSLLSRYRSSVDEKSPLEGGSKRKRSRQEGSVGQTETDKRGCASV